MPSYKPVNAALRVLDVLASVNRLYGRATVGEIHRQTGINKATIVRMLETLCHAGYVVRDPDEPIYGITGKTLMLSAAFDRHKGFSAVVAPFLSEFREDMGWPSDVAMFDHDAMLVIESSRLGGPLSFNRAPGHRFPVLGASLGLTYLAWCPEHEREEIIEQAAADPAPWNDIARDAGVLEQELSTIRERGYAIMAPSYCRQEYKNRVSSIGVPIMSGEVAQASINVLYLTNVLDASMAREQFLAPLKNVATRIGREMEIRSASPTLN